MKSSPSPFVITQPGMRIREGSPPLPRPTKDEIATFPKQAQRLLDKISDVQESLLESNQFDLKWMRGKHFVLAGATGFGLGGALATAILNLMRREGGSLTIIARDLGKSVGYETGAEMKVRAEAGGWGNRFQWLNSGLASEGVRFEKIVEAVKATGADQVIYFNTVAAASSGMLPGHPPIYVPDVDDQGLMAWKLTELSEKSIAATKNIMGTLSVEFPDALEAAGIPVEARCFADWRGSLDKGSRDPSSTSYGQWGAYSTSLYLPKDVIHDATAAAYGTDKLMMDFYYPVMHTRALELIPGGKAMAYVHNRLMTKEGIRHIGVPELALRTLNYLGYMLETGDINPFPRLDAHEDPVDLWFFEVIRRINDDPNSEFYYKKWIELD